MKKIIILILFMYTQNVYAQGYTDLDGRLNKLEKRVDEIYFETDVYTKTVVDDKLENKVDKSTFDDLSTQVSDKADKSEIEGLKTQVSGVGEHINGIKGSINEISTQVLAVDEKLGTKAEQCAVDDLKEQVSGVSDSVGGISTKVYDIESAVSEISNKVLDADRIVAGIDDRIMSVEEGIDDVKSQVSGMENSVVSATTKVEEMNSKVNEIETSYDGIKEDVHYNKAAVGQVEKFGDAHYTRGSDNLSDAVVALDSEVYRLDAEQAQLRMDVSDLRKKFNSGMASMAALTALVPNARANGNTQLAIGTGAYEGHTAMAIGGFHWVNDNILLNAGVSWGNSSDKAYRMGITYSW